MLELGGRVRREYALERRTTPPPFLKERATPYSAGGDFSNLFFVS